MDEGTHWTMMVIFQHATVAYTTVMCPLGGMRKAQRTISAYWSASLFVETDYSHLWFDLMALPAASSACFRDIYFGRPSYTSRLPLREIRIPLSPKDAIIHRSLRRVSSESWRYGADVVVMTKHVGDDD